MAQGEGCEAFSYSFSEIKTNVQFMIGKWNLDEVSLMRLNE